MEALVERLYRRLGSRYGVVIAGWLAVVAFATGGMTLASSIPYVNATAEQLKVIGVMWAATNTVALIIVALLVRRRITGVFRWIRGDRSEELAHRAWEDLVSHTFELGMRGVIVFLVVALPTELIGGHIFALAWYGTAAAMIAIAVSIILSGMLDYLGVELLARPVLREIAAFVSTDLEPDGPAPSLRWRLMLGMTITSLYGVILGAAIASSTFAPATKILVGVTFSVFLSGTLVLFTASLLSASVLTPVTDIVRAMREVETGSLDAKVPVLGADEVGFLARSFNQMVSGLAEREVLRSAMGTYVDPHIAARILSEGAELAGDELDVSVLFLDIRDFTASADGQAPRQTVAALNEFFALIVPVILRHGGHANKFLGDGLLAVFGAPESFEDHADRAVGAAAEIVSVVDERYRGALRVGVGLNSGRVVVGSVGGGGRLEFTLIGDTVNVAKRVEQLTKDFGDTILMTEATRSRLTTDEHALTARSAVPMRGKAGTVELFALTTPIGQPGSS